MASSDHRRPIVVGIDGSGSALHAARWAAVEAARRDLSLLLVHAYEIPLGYPPGIADPDAVRSAMREQGLHSLAAARDAVTEVEPGVRTQLRLHRAATVPALARESQDAAMVVVGTRGLGGFTGLLVGSTAVALSARSHCPLVVVRGSGDGPVSGGQPAERPSTPRPIVVGVDGTPASEAAVAFAFEEAASHGTDLIAVHAWTDSVFETVIETGAANLDFAPLQQWAYETLSERLAGWQEKYPEVKVAREVVRDRPARTLLRYAQTAGLVVVGSRGLGGFRGLLIGSTSQHLLHHAPCPVVVVRTATD